MSAEAKEKNPTEKGQHRFDRGKHVFNSFFQSDAWQHEAAGICSPPPAPLPYPKPLIPFPLDPQDDGEGDE